MRLLHWQDRHRVDVLFVLFACWLPHGMTPADWRVLAQGSNDWNRRATRRIRALRRQMPKASWAEGYRSCLELEQSAERVEAAWLTRVASSRRRVPTTAGARHARLRRLFPGLPESEIAQLLVNLPA